MTDQAITELSHMGSLNTAVTSLLAEAAGLPDPGSMSVYGILNGSVHDSVTLHFAPVEASTEAIAQWAIRFGGVIASWTDDFQGVPTRWVRTKFTWPGLVEVDAFAAIPLPQYEAIITTADQPSEPVTGTPF